MLILCPPIVFRLCNQICLLCHGKATQKSDFYFLELLKSLYAIWRKIDLHCKNEKKPKKFHQFLCKDMQISLQWVDKSKIWVFLHFHRQNLSFLLVYRFYQKVQYRPQKIAKTSFWPFIIITCIDK